MQIIKSKVHNNYKKDITSINLINDNNFEICFYNYGGYIHNIFIPYKKNEKIREDVILGYDDQKQLIEAPGYFNSIIGRVGNRINNSKFTLNKKVYNLNSNIYPNHLHGGNEGFNKKIWEIVDLKKVRLIALNIETSIQIPSKADIIGISFSTSINSGCLSSIC